jgi:hypothetical protein
LWAIGAALIVILMAFAAVVPQTRNAHTMAFGDWTSAVKISNEAMGWGDISDWAVYMSGMDNMTYSSDNGASWVPEKAMGGWIDATGSVLYRVNSTDPYSGNLFFEKSFDNGTTWSTPVDLGLPAANDGYYGICLLNGSLFVYDWDSITTSDILIKRSSDLGSTWSDTIPVIQTSMPDPPPNHLVFLDGTIYMVYWNEEFIPPSTYTDKLFVIHSNDMGDTWEGNQYLDTGAMSQVKEDGGVLYVSYIHPEFVGLDIYGSISIIKSTDGASWTAPLTVAKFTNATDPSLFHSLAVSEGRIAVAYLDYRVEVPADKYTVRVNYSADDGITWTDLGDVTGMSTNAELPTVMIKNNTLLFFWVDLGTGDWTGDPHPTYYRSMDLTGGPVIAEFATLMAPVLGFIMVLVVASHANHRRR